IYRRLFFTATPTTEIYTLSLHDALPIFGEAASDGKRRSPFQRRAMPARSKQTSAIAGKSWMRSRTMSSKICGVGIRTSVESKARSEEHTSELQSRFDLVCRLLLEKKKKK